MTRILIDTNILIDVARAIVPAITRLTTEAQSSTLSISIVTQMELTVGCRNRAELQNLDRFLQQYEIIKLNADTSNKALELLQTYNLSHGLLIPDAFIAATAISSSYPQGVESNIPLLSKNQRDYRFISELNLMPYP